METEEIKVEQKVLPQWFKPGQSGNPNGRPPMTDQQRAIKKATKEFIAEYKEGLGEALPLISPVLIAKALEGDIPAIKEIHDRVMGKSEAKTDITSGGEKIMFLPAELINKNNISNDSNTSTIENS